jgi:hypothetical protein
MSDREIESVLHALDATHELRWEGRTLMFNLDFDTDVISIRSGLSSKDHVVRFAEHRFCDHLTTLRRPITEALIAETLIDIYDRPERYGLRRLSS